MSEVETGQSLLENAYELSPPADNAKYYDAFAATCDSDVAAEGLIGAPSYAPVRMYDQDGQDHSGDVAILARYRKQP
ncbi:MAG: hypothetical protein ACFBRM_05795 [Pikeienuella sp.]